MKAFMLNQKGTIMYLTVAPVKVLVGKAKVERWTEEHAEGYQRVADELRFAPELSRSLIRYLREEEGVFATSILVNIRGKLAFKQDKDGNGVPMSGELDIPQDESWWILDGQHRVEALERMLGENPGFASYPVPVTIFNFTAKDHYDEMRQFYIHNSRVKSVPVDLVWRILQKMYKRIGRVALMESEGVPALRSAQALDIAERLRTVDGSPWKGKIITPGVGRTPEQFLPERTLVRSLIQIIKETTFAAMDPNKLTSLLAEYWWAIKELFPKAGNNPREYTLLRSTGVIAFHIAFPAVYGQCTTKGSFTREAMKSVLQKIKLRTGRRLTTPMDDETWNSRTGHGLAISTSMKSITMLAGDMIEMMTT